MRGNRSTPSSITSATTPATTTSGPTWSGIPAWWCCTTLNSTRHGRRRSSGSGGRRTSGPSSATAIQMRLPAGGSGGGRPRRHALLLLAMVHVPVQAARVAAVHSKYLARELAGQFPNAHIRHLHMGVPDPLASVTALPLRSGGDTAYRMTRWFSGRSDGSHPKRPERGPARAGAGRPRTAVHQAAHRGRGVLALRSDGGGARTGRGRPRE